MNRGFRKELSRVAGAAGLIAWAMGRRKTAASLGALAAGLAFLPGEVFHYRGKSVVITGGSRGLGLAMARELIKAGARVTLLARDENELAHARAQLMTHPRAEVLVLACDVTDNQQVAKALDQATEHFRTVDVWINNAGAITVGPFESMDERDFEAQLNLHLRANVGITQLLVPYFRRRGGGRIVNISSIGGAIPVPHLSAYCMSKYALAGFATSVAPELARENIHVTTAYPSLMRTGSPIQAVFKGDHQREYAWFSASDNVPFLSISAPSAARTILRAAADKRVEVYVGLPAKLGHLAHAQFPESFAWSLRAVSRLLPNRQSHARRTGADIRALGQGSGWKEPLRWIAEKAEREFNQRAKEDAEFNLGSS